MCYTCGMPIIAVANQKGGVAKTTTACNLAAGLAIRGHRTLLVDLDQQRNASMSFELPEDADITLADVLVGHESRKPLSDAIYETHIVGLDIVPASIRLAVIERAVQIDEQYRLKDAIDGAANDYGFVIIDCPPSLGMTLTQALLAATHVLVPIAAQYYPLEGVVDLAQTIAQMKRPNPRLTVLGYLVTMFDRRSKICGEADAKIREMFGGDVFEVIIRQNVRLQTAPAVYQSIYEHAPDAHGSLDYAALTDEVLERLEVKSPVRLVKGDSA